MPVSPPSQSEEKALAGRLLDRARAMTGPALRAWAGHLPPHSRSLAGYHLGWLDADGQPSDGRSGGGKAVRPALAYASCEAVGGNAPAAVGAAVAVELVHNFSLMHDDVIDRDPLRRHRLTVWKQFGLPAALLGGDALLTLAFRVLADSFVVDGARALRVLGGATVELIEGEALDTAFEQRRDVTVSEYLVMAEGKTGSLMGAACALGALAGGADEEATRHLTRFGRRLGVAFQIADDVLGLFGDAQRTGKPVGGDLLARKKTYPILTALASGTAAGNRLAALCARPGPLDTGSIGQAVELIDEAGGRRAAHRQAARELERAHTELVGVGLRPAAVRELTALAHLLTHRTT